MKVMEQLKPKWPSEENKTIAVWVHSFYLSDVDDPDLYAAEPMYQWEKSEEGQWLMKNSSLTPTWHRNIDNNTMGYKYQIRAYLSPKNYTYWKLKFG